MRLPMLVISLLAAVPGAGRALLTHRAPTLDGDEEPLFGPRVQDAWAARTATEVAPAATVSGVTVTNAGTYRSQSVSAPSGAGQFSPTGTIGTASNWHFVSKTSEVAGEVGIQFGIEFRLEGNPVGDTVTLHMVPSFPRKESAIRIPALRCIPPI